jgi:ATP-binding cassette subfamily B protein
VTPTGKGNRHWARGFRTLIGFAFRAAPREAVLFLLCGAIMAAAGPVAALGSKLLVDAALARDSGQALLAAGLLAAAAGGSLLNTLYYLDFLFTVAEKAGAVVDRRLMELMTRIPGLEHHERPEYLRELDLLREQRGRLAWMTNATAGMVRVAVGLTASLALLARLDLALLVLPILGLGSFFTGRRAAALRHAADEASAEPERLRRHLFELSIEAPPGKEIRLFGLADELATRHHRIAETVIREKDRATWQSAALDALGSVLFGLGYVSAIGLVLWRAMQGSLTPGDVVLTIGLAASLNYAVQVAVGYGTQFLDVLRIAQRYLWLEDYAARVGSTPPHPLPAPERLRNGIAIEHLTFRYSGNGQTVLDDVSVFLPAGSVVALVGENGAGKTTLVKLLSQFYEPKEGCIRVDDRDLARIPITAWRERMSSAYQDFARFELLVRETVGVGELSRIEDTGAVEGALARAGADDVPARLPRGLETQLGRGWEGGVELSGGQWQKLALARAMMRAAPLLVIFDEPTAALDAPTEHALFERVADAARSDAGAGTVTILVTHRFSTVRMADLIVVLNQGKLAEVGRHADLLASGGLYAELYRLQARAYK